MVRFDELRVQDEDAMLSLKNNPDFHGIMMMEE